MKSFPRSPRQIQEGHRKHLLVTECPYNTSYREYALIDLKNGVHEPTHNINLNIYSKLNIQSINGDFLFVYLIKGTTKCAQKNAR